MNKLKEPNWLPHYKTGLLKNCFTCSYFNNPVCELYNQEPPEEFANSFNECQDQSFDGGDIPF